MLEIDRGITLSQIPDLISAHGSDGGLEKDDISYHTDLAWRNSWRAAGEVVPVGDRQTQLISDTSRDVPVLTTTGEFMPTPGEERIGKGRPSYVESLFATEKRLVWLREYLSHLPENVLGVISGGSMSYGRFHNVRAGYPNSSDLDLLIVSDHPPTLTDIDQLVRVDLGFQTSELVQYRQRAQRFEAGYHNEDLDVFSQKFSMPSQGFDVDMHIFPFDVLRRLLGESVKNDALRARDTEVNLRAYKADSFPERLTDKQSDFYGNVYSLPRAVSLTRYGKVALDHAYLVQSGNFIPGSHQNLCSPMFEVVLDRGGIGDMMDGFKTFIYENVDAANRKKPGAALSNSHLRSVLFSKHVRIEMDSRR
jgi:hypothetical protein